MNNDFTVELVGKYFKYFSQFNNNKIDIKLPVERMSAKMLCSKYSQEFERLIKISKKFKIDIVEYLNYFIVIKHFTKNQISTHLLNKNTFLEYLTYKQHVEKLKNIYNCYIKSIKYLAKKCIKANTQCKEYLIDLILTNKLLPLVLSGKISIYYLVALPNFKQIVLKMDENSQQEFKYLVDNFEIYNSEINEAYMFFKNLKANPIKNVNTIINNVINKITQ